MGTRLAALAVATLLACDHRPERARDPSPEEDTSAPLLPPVPADAGPPSACQVNTHRVVFPAPREPVDVGDTLVAPIESPRVIALPGGRRALWIDNRQGTLHLGAEGRGAISTHRLPPGERSDPILAAAPGPPVAPAVAWVRDAPSGRTHVIRVGDNLERGCRHTEQRDESLALSAVSTPGGLLVAWDEEGPGRWPGSIRVQRVPAAAVGTAARDEQLPVCPSAVQVTPLEHDAHDPTLVALPDGATTVLWLNARDLDPFESNDAATNVWARLLDPRGQPVGAPLRLMSTPGRRFGVSASATDPSVIWVAFRASDETDSISRDDGDVMVVRVERGATGLVRASDALRVNAPDGNPTGVPAIFARPAGVGGARVFWTERAGATAITLQRMVAGARTGPIRALPLHVEPLARGELPRAQDRGGTFLVPLADARGGLEISHLRCADDH